jgi:hypothetical protein
MFSGVNSLKKRGGAGKVVGIWACSSAGCPSAISAMQLREKLKKVDIKGIQMFWDFVAQIVVGGFLFEGESARRRNVKERPDEAEEC